MATQNEMAEAIKLGRRIQTQINLYRQLTQDNHYGAEVKDGKVRLVYVTFAANGKSKVQARSGWLAPAAWFEFMLEQSI